LVFDLRSAHEVESFLHKLLDEKDIIQEVLNLYIHKNHLERISSDVITDYEVNILSTKVNIKNLLLIHEAREIKYDEIKERAIVLDVLTCKPKPLIMGRDLIALGLEPSPIFSDILNALYDAQLREHFLTYDDAKLWLKEYLKEFNLY
jgi:hypothetical protein